MSLVLSDFQGLATVTIRNILDMYVHSCRCGRTMGVRAIHGVVDSYETIEECLASMEKRVLLIDDDPQFIERMRGILGNTVNLLVVSVAEDAMSACLSWRPHLILLDVLIAPGDPFKILDDISSTGYNDRAAVLCLSRGAGATTRLQRFGDTIFGTLKRETDTEALLSTISRALQTPDHVAA